MSEYSTYTGRHGPEKTPPPRRESLGPKHVPDPLPEPSGKYPTDDIMVPSPTTEIIIRPTGGTTLSITPSMVAELLCPGMPIRESLRFLLMCKQGGLNPFQEVYIDKRANDHGSYDYNFIISKWAYIRLATSHPHYRGHTYEDHPALERCDKPTPVVWGRCKVNRLEHPELVFDLSYEEAISRVTAGGGTAKAKGYCTAQPRMYLRLVTVARALREAFPDRLANVYLAEEM